MRQVTSRAALVLLPVLLLASTADGAKAPELRVSADGAGILVKASDAEGLDSIEILCPELDAIYRSGLGGKSPTRQLQRSFTLRELFPEAREERPLRVTVTIRNTRGASASKTIQLQKNQTKDSSTPTGKED